MTRGARTLRRGFCDTPLGQAHYVEAGSVTGTPVVLLHQTPRSVDEFAEVLPLIARERRVVALDTPGYGCSDAVPGQPSVADYAGAVFTLLDRLGAARADLVGHHTGALIALECAAARPERVGRIVLSGPVWLDARTRPELARHFVQWQLQPDGGHLADKWQKMTRWTRDPCLVHRIVVDIFRAGEASEQGHLAVAEYRMEDRLPLVRCPVLLLYAADDPFADPSEAGRYRALLPDVREARIEGGVFAANENPEGFADAVARFLAD